MYAAKVVAVLRDSSGKNRNSEIANFVVCCKGGWRLRDSSGKNRIDAPTCPTFEFVLSKQPVLLSSGSVLFVIAPSCKNRIDAPHLCLSLVSNQSYSHLGLYCLSLPLVVRTE